MKKKLFLSCLILMISLFTSATNYQVSSLAALEAQENGLSPGDSVFLKAGSYSSGFTLKKSHSEEVVFVLDGIDITSNDRFTIDLRGKHITLLMKNVNLSGGKQAGIGVRGDYIKVIGENTLITDNNFGMLMVGTNHHIEGLVFKGQTSTGITGNNLLLNPKTRETAQAFHWDQPDNNWLIYKCKFYNIYPSVPGDAGGAIRIIPYVEGVKIVACEFYDIGGSCVWFDHCRDRIEVIGCLFKGIRNQTGKCIFLEITDPRPNSEAPFVAKILGNRFIDVDKQTILIAASHGVKPRGIEVALNWIQGGWGIGAAAMERDFYRRYDKSDRSTWQLVHAKLDNIYFHHNVIQPTTGRNHFWYYKGQYGGNNVEFENNYYVVGSEYNYIRPSGDLETDIIKEGRIYQGGDKMNPHDNPIQPVSFYDKNAIIGPPPETFPWLEMLEGLDVVTDTSGTPIDTTITDPPDTTVTPPTITDKPAIWIISDLSSGRTDPDDRVSTAMVLVALDKVDLKGFTIGAHKWDLSGVLEGWFNPNIGNAYAQEVAALNAEYGGFPDVLPMHESVTTGKGFKEGSITELTGSLQAMYEAAQQVVNQGKKFYVLLWGPQNEAAYFADYAMRQTDQRVFLNTVFISHASSPSELNNCSKDAEACAFLHNLAAQGKIKYYEMGFSGKVIDNGTFPKIGTEVLKSKIGSFLQEKWKVEKPDGSDAFIYYAAFVPEVGGGLDYLSTLKSDGTSNEAKLMNDFSKPTIYAFLQTRYAVASSGKTGSPDVGNGGNQISLKQELQTIIDALLRIVNGL